jgi:Uma2 family endonuclease
MVSQLKRTYTSEEYLALEVEAETRSEDRNGEIVLMTGGTPEHNDISASLVAYLKVALRGKPYHVFVTAQRLWIPSKNLYTYPDVMAI